MSDLNVRASFRDKVPLDDDDSGSKTVQIANPTEYSAPVTVCSLYTRSGRRARIIGLHQSWDANIDGFVQWALFVGGKMHYKYSWSDGQIANPAQGQTDLPSEVVVSGGQPIEIRAVLPAAAGAPGPGAVTGRIRVIYEAY